MKSMQLPQMSTVKPSGSTKHSDNGDCTDYLNRNFSLKAPDLVWVSDITYLKAEGKWYHLCIIMDLFSRKVISWKLSAKADAGLVMDTFKRAFEKRNRMHCFVHLTHHCLVTQVHSLSKPVHPAHQNLHPYPHADNKYLSYFRHFSLPVLPFSAALFQPIFQCRLSPSFRNSQPLPLSFHKMDNRSLFYYPQSCTAHNKLSFHKQTILPTVKSCFPPLQTVPFFSFQHPQNTKEPKVKLPSTPSI